jgi:hypothetical protein
LAFTGLPLGHSSDAAESKESWAANASAGALGTIEDEDLRQRILATFYQAKSLIEAINYQHERYQVYEALTRVPGTAETHALKEDLVQWADKVIRDRLKPLQEKLPGLIEDIQKFLDS